MATASLLDMQFIAQDSFFANMVKSSVYGYCISTVQSETNNSHQARKAFAASVLNSPNTYIPNFTWAAATNQTLADGVITTGNAGAHFTTSTTAAAVTAAVQAGSTDTNINNAVASAFNALANV